MRRPSRSAIAAVRDSITKFDGFVDRRTMKVPLDDVHRFVAPMVGDMGQGCLALEVDSKLRLVEVVEAEIQPGSTD